MDSSVQKELIKCGVGLAVGTCAMTWLYNQIINYKERHYLQNIVKVRQKKRTQEFTGLENQYTLSHEARRIIELNFEELKNQLAMRKLSATQVLKAYIAKALEVNKECNCITEFNSRAMEMARELDGMTQIKGPLHGIPFCVKDDTNVIGMDSTVGFAKNINKPAQVNAVIVQVIIDLGGIPFCRTNLPQSCVSNQSHNPIFGETLNPLNKKLSPGGSSSGTCALVASGGAPFGTGTDTGGSLRCPAHYCGVSTLKSSKNRLSRKGCLLCVENCVGFVPIPGIIAKSATGVSSIVCAMIESNLHNQYDGKVVPLPWNQKIFESSNKLRIGFFTTMDVCPTIGDSSDNILSAKSALESLGHTLIPFELNECKHYANLALELLLADLGVHLVDKLKNDQISPVICHLYHMGHLSYWKRRLCSILPSWINYYNPKMIQAGLNVEYSTNLWDKMGERHFIIEKLLKRMNLEKIDLILCPVASMVAPLIDYNTPIDLFMYTIIWSLMDFPAGVIKFGKESGQYFNDKNYENETPLIKIARKNIKESIGMPIGVQIVGKPFQEELVLRVMVELEKLQTHGST